MGEIASDEIGSRPPSKDWGFLPLACREGLDLTKLF